MSYATIYVRQLVDASNPNNYIGKWKGSGTIPYTKYNIKETDFRVKTATFTSPAYYDLTKGQYAILINSKYHENFAGIILEVEYDEETGLYSYQCQDWGRKYIGKFETIAHNVNFYKLLRHLISLGKLPLNPTKEQKKAFKPIISGLRALDKYNQSYYEGNIYGGNPFNQTISLISRDKSWIEVIRGLVFNSLGYFDVWFNDKGILQIEPLSKTDWEETGLVLSDGGYYDRKFKFSTTNAITGVVVNGEELSAGSGVTSQKALGVDLSAFFGKNTTSISNPNQSNAVKDTKKTNTSNKNAKGKTPAITNKWGNPFNDKRKKLMIDADGGSDSMKHQLAKAMHKAGWAVTVRPTDDTQHYWDYFYIKKNYSVLATVYNGFCCGTMREAYGDKIQNVLKKKGVQLVPIFETGDWKNRKKMKNFAHGDFTKYHAKRAHDDWFSRGNPEIKNVDKFMKQHKATYCCAPTCAEIMQQFNAGGYYKYKGIKV